MNTYGIFSTLRLAAAFRATLARFSQRPWLALSLLLGVVCAGQAQAAITVRLTNSTYAVYQSLHPAETQAGIMILRYNSPSDDVNDYTNHTSYYYSGNITDQTINVPHGSGYYRAIYYKGSASQANPNCSISPWGTGTAVSASDGSTVDLTAVCVPPDVTPPTVQSAATSTDGLSVDVTFSENIDYYGDGSDFSLTVNGVSRAITYASFSDDVLTLTVSPTIAAGTTVLLSYSNEWNLYDLAANDAASFSNQPVTNNVVASDPTATISVSPASVAEDGTPNLVYTVTLSAPAASNTSVAYTVTGTATSGVDYAAVTSPVVITTGNSSATITVNPTADATIEANETAIITLNAGAGYVVGAPSSATGTILNDDLPNLIINDVTLSEGNSGTTSANFTVSLSSPAGPGGVTFDIATANGTASAGPDYVASSLTSQTISSGNNIYNFSVTLNGDVLNEPSETFFVNVTNVSNAVVVDGQGVGTILNDDPPPSLSVDDVSVVEGHSGSTNASFTVSLNAASGQTVTVNYATADGTAAAPADYTSTSGTLTFTAGQTSKTVNVAVNGDNSVESSETFALNLSGASNATIADNSGTATITNDDVTIVFDPATLTNGALQAAYSQQLSASGATAPYSYSISAGSLPTGLSLSAAGLLSGTPSAVGPFNFTVSVTDSSPFPGPYSASTSYSLTIDAIAPGAPTIGTVTAGDGQVTVAFSAPASDGGSAITGYTVTSNPSGLIGTGSSSPIVVTGLSNGTAYTFTVTATNAVGTSVASSASGAATPMGNQTITFANPGAQNFGTTPTLTATATSGLDVTFDSGTPGVCTITSGGTLTFISDGSCTIDAAQAGDGSWNAATPVSQTFTVNAVVPDAPTVGTATAGNTQATVSFTAPASSGGSAITGYTVTSNPSGLTGTGGSSPIVVTGLTNGTAYTFTVTATNAAGTGAASAASNAVTPAAPQTITFNTPNPQNFGTTPTLMASTDATGLIPTFSSATPSVCTITSGGMLTFISAGTCTINADQAGNAAYLPAPQVSRSFTVNPVVPAAPTSVVATAGNALASVAFTAPASSGGSAITGYTVTSSPGGLTATGSGSPIVVTGLTNGVAYTFTVTADNIAGTGPVSAASSPVTPQATQLITFSNPGAQDFGTSPTLTASADSSLAVTFSSTTPAVCTVTSDGVLTFVSAGSCTITAEQAGNAAYLAAAPVSNTFTINAVVADAPTAVSANAGDGSATISFTAPASNGGSAITGYTVTSSPGGLTATGSGSPIVVTGLTNGVAYTFTVTATNSAGDSLASAASSPVIPLGLQSISFDEPSAQNFGTSPSLSATASSGLPITFSSATPEVCTVTAEGVVTFIATGSCTVHADQSGSANYQAASRVSRTFTINAVVADAPSAISATAGDGSATISFTAPASNGGSAITGYAVTSSPGGLTATGSGSPIVVNGLTNGVAYTFTVTATNSAGDSLASAASSPAIPLGLQSISFDEPSAQNFGTTPTLSATASSGLAVAFSSATPEVCTITAEGVLAFIATGSCTVHADQSGSANYQAASRVSRTFTINAVVADAPTAVSANAGDGSATISFTASASNGGAAISSYTVTASPGGLTASGNGSPIVLSGLTNGVAYTFTVTATNGAGDSAASAASSPVVPMGQQSISFDEPSAQNFGTSPSLSATASSGLPITFSSATPEVCTVTAEGVVTFIATGSCTIHADQSGSANYLAASRVSRTFTINAVAADAPTAVSATAGDGSATISFTAPASNGGSAISGYRVTASPGGATVTANNAPINISGLQNGTSYNFTVAALNDSGVSGESAPSNSVTPKGEQSISFTSPGEQTAGTSLQLNATTSSGLGLLFSSATPEVCIISASGLLELLAAGQCSLTVEQPGNGAWLAAPSQSQSFNVLAANQLPTISGTPATTVTVGEAYLFAPVANDADATDTLTFSISNKPAWASFDSSSGRLSGTPTEDNIGVTNGILISVSDGQASSALPAFSLQVVAVDDSLPQLTPPASVTVNADALFTRLSMRTLLGLAANASDDAVAAALAALASDSTDGNDCCTTAPDGLTASGSLLLPPGRHNVRWVATNSRGDSVSAIQQVNVNPLISLSKSQLALRGSAVEMRVILNGDAPSYPLVVAYAIDDASTATAEEHSLVNGEVRFERAGQLEIAVPIRLTDLTGRNDSELIVQLAGVGNFGAQNSHSIGIREGNIAPSVSLQLQQNGVFTSLIAADGGLVTATAIVTDANSGDSHSFSWRAANGLSDSDGDDADGSFSFDPAALSGSHQLHVTATDSAGASGESSASFRVVAALPQLSSAQDSDDDGIDDASEGTADSDGNGIPDYLDNMPSSNILPQVGSQTRAYLVECDPGVRCGLGLFALNGNSGGVQIFNEELGSSGQPVIDPAFEPVGGVFDFAIRDLPTPGQSVRVVLPQRAPIPAAAVYRKFRNGSWVTFVEDEANALHSAAGEAGYCPPPGAVDWTPGLTAGHLCVQLTIEDGGANDDDGVVNSAVVDPGAVSSPLAVAPPADHEFNTKGGGSMGLFTVALLALLGWLRRRPQWCALLLAGLLAAGHSQAADLDGFYLRGDLYQAQGSDSASSLNDALAADGIDGSVSYYDVDRVAYQLALGYRWQPWTYTELGYLDLGEVSVNLTVAGDSDEAALRRSLGNNYPAAGDGISLVQGLAYPLAPAWQLAGELGLWAWRGNIDVEGGELQLDYHDNIEPLVGLRLDYQLNQQLGVGLSARRVVFDGQHVDLWGLSASWQF